MSTQNTIAFSPSGKHGNIATGKSVLEAARQLGVGIESSCGGNGQCGKCQVIISEGKFAKYGISSASHHVSEFSPPEMAHQKTGYLRDGHRLACCAKVNDNVVIDVPSFSQVQKQMVRKAANIENLSIAENIKLYNVELAEPNMHDQDGDAQLLKKALWFEYDLQNLQINHHVLTYIQSALKAGERKLAVAIRGNDVVAIFANKNLAKQKLYGVAFDVGSTTIAAHIICLNDGEILATNGQMNPQIRFGEDVMARVSFIMMNDDGLANMNQVVTQTISELIATLVEESGIERNRLLEAVFVANPIMHHILLNIDPTLLGQSPFVLASNEAIYVESQQIRVDMPSGAKSYILPCIAGHVGADAASVLLSVKPEQYDGWTLAVDIGTNAEIILGSKDKILACSSPTGPAFEGAQISSGQRAAIGAIERITIDKDTLEPAFKIIGCDLWSNESGFAEATADIAISGICGSGIIEVMSALYLAEIINEDGVFDASLATKTSRIIQQGRTYAYLVYRGNVDLYITQNDIRQVQLAKSALYAGIKLLMDKAGIDKLDRIFLAGAFGSHIDVKQAMILGIIPDCALDNVSAIGNAAGNGAIKALLSIEERDYIEQAVRQIYKIETAIEPSFQEYFVNAMAIPNKVDTFPELSHYVSLPQKKSNENTDGESKRGGRRRRRKS